MIRIRENVPGYYLVELTWPQGTGVQIELELTDPDGETETDTIGWVAGRDYPLVEAIDGIVGAVDALTHWRAVRIGSEISIGPASQDYTGNVSLVVTEAP